MFSEKFENKKLKFHFDTVKSEDLRQINAIDDREEEHAEMLELQDKGEGKFFVARDGNEIAGYVFVYYEHESAHFPDKKTPFLEDLMVGQKFRKKGLGKQLLEMCETEIKDKGEQELYFAVLADNDNAINFYKKNGYHRIPEMDFETPGKEIGYYFRKDLE